MVSFNIEKYRDLSIWLEAGGGDESDTGGEHAGVGRLEIIDAKEQPDPAGELIPDDRRLELAVSAGEQNAGAPSGGSDDDPAFWSAIVRQ